MNSLISRPRAVTSDTSANSKLSRRGLIYSYREGAARVSAAQSLEERSSELAAGAVQSVLQAHPEIAAYERLVASCARDINFFIKLIISALVYGSTQVLDDYLLIGMSEVYRALGLSMSCAINALLYIKHSHRLIEAEAQLTNEYIDYIISGLS
ncbi:MAG: phycocyanin subunit alpha [Symploca sp. SIO2E6]|nr:phycocyanin subunit alpha [Symploca sp. SIO2E6]